MNKFIFLVFIPLLAALTHAAVNTVAVLEIIPSGDMKLKLSEYRHLTDELRTKAREALPQSNYAILTRDNILSLMPPDSEEAQCLAESCAVEIGRAIGAEYVTQGFVGEFDGLFTLTVELYESISGNLLGSFVTESDNLRGLLKAIREKAPGLFARIPVKPLEPKQKSIFSLKKNIDSELDNNKPVAKKIDPQVESVEKKSNVGFWVALALDVLGSAILLNGYFEDKEVAQSYKKYSSLGNSSSQSEIDSAWQEVYDNRDARNSSYVVGSIFLVAGIGVHIWF